MADLTPAGRQEPDRDPAGSRQPAEDGDATLTPEQQAALDNLFAARLHLGGGGLDRDELHAR